MLLWLWLWLWLLLLLLVVVTISRAWLERVDHQSGWLQTKIARVIFQLYTNRKAAHKQTATTALHITAVTN